MTATPPNLDARALTPALAVALACGLAPGCGDAPDGGATHEATSHGTSDAAPAAAESAPGDGWFREVAMARGLDFVHDAGLLPEKHLPETMGAGVALLDVDADGDLDAYLVQGGPMELPGRPTDGPRNALFLNDGTARFHDASAHAADGAHPGYGMAVAQGDVDGDGDPDLLVTNLGPDVLLLNDGSGRFRDASATAGLGDPRWTSSAALFDADNDGDLDAYVAAYLDVDLTRPEWCGRREPGWRSACHPDVYADIPDRFYRNDGSAHFLEDTADAGLSSSPGQHGKGLGVLASDLDADGWPDLYVANDSVENRLWWNTGDGRFTDGTLLSGTGVNGRGATEAGMGLAAGDVDADGDAELFVTNFDDESNTLYRNDGDGLFADVTAPAGLDGSSRLPVGFGALLADLDADGDLDVAVTNGHIIDNIALYHDGKTHAQRGLLFRNDGAGRFADISALGGGLTDTDVVGRGLASGDLDGDGDLDLLLSTCGGRARLLLNDGPADEPRGSVVLLAGLPRGTRVEAELADGRRLWREAGPQPSYFSQTAADVHLGLGASSLVGLTFHPPGGGAPQRPPIAAPLRDVRLTLGRPLDLDDPWTSTPLRVAP